MKKFLRVALLAVIFTVFAVSSVKALTNDELVDYLLEPKTVAGKTITLTADESGIIKKFFKSNKVSDEDAAAIKAKAEEALDLMEKAGKSDITKLPSATKDRIEQLGIEAGEIAGVTVKVDRSKKIFTVTDKNGKRLYAENYVTRQALTYTGADYTIYIVPAVAIIAVAMVVIVRKVRK